MKPIQTAVIRRRQKSILVEKKGLFFIKDPTIKGTSVFWFSSELEGIVFYRYDLISLANMARSYFGSYMGVTDPSKMGYSFCPLTLNTTSFIKLKRPDLYNKLEIHVNEKASKAFDSLKYTTEEVNALKEKLDAGLIAWWEAPALTGASKNNPAFLNIGGYFVTAGPVYKNYGATNPRFIAGKRGIESSYFSKSPAGEFVHFIPNSAHLKFSNGIIMIPELVLVNPVTLEPDFKKTYEWHNGDKETVKSLRKSLHKVNGYFSHPCGPYITESWTYLDQITEDLDSLPHPTEAMEHINKCFVEIMTPECTCTTAGWVPVRVVDDQPLYDANGKYLKQKDSGEVFRWGLRLGFTMNGKDWGKAVTVWASYRPDIDADRPWRVIKSTICQRKNNWSKSDSSVTGRTYYNQILPDVQHAIPEWAVVFMAQGAEQYPALYKPQFVGAKKVLTGSSALKQKLASSNLSF